VEQKPIPLRGLGVDVDVQVRRRDEPLFAASLQLLTGTVKRLLRVLHCF